MKKAEKGVEQEASWDLDRGMNTLTLVGFVKDFKSDEFTLRATEVGEDPDCICISEPLFGCIEVKLFNCFPKSWWESIVLWSGMVAVCREWDE